MLQKTPLMPSKTSLKRNAYEILSQIKFKGGEIVFLDLDETLLYSHTKGVMLAHPKLPALLRKLHSQSVICIGLTARPLSFQKNTESGLQTLELDFDLAKELFQDYEVSPKLSYANGVFYSPPNIVNGEEISTKGITAVSIVETLLDATKHAKARHVFLEKQGLRLDHFAKRVILLDDLPINCAAVEQCFQSFLEEKGNSQLDSVTTYLVQSTPLWVSEEDRIVLPENLSHLRLKENLGAHVYLLENEKNNHYFIFKAHENLDYLQEELIAAELYRSLGCHVPGTAILAQIPTCLANQDLPMTGIYRLSRYIPASSLKPGNNEEIQKELAKVFLVDVLLGNGDIAEADFKNFVIENNILYRLHTHNALRNRAEGNKEQKPKISSWWSPYFVNEFNVFPNTIPSYKHLSQEALCEQHDALVQNISEMFHRLEQLAKVININKIAELRSMLAARLYDLEIHLHPRPHPYAKAFESLHADDQQNSASILVISEFKSESFVLLARRKPEPYASSCKLYYSDLGGKSELYDVNLFAAATREAAEETGGMINPSIFQLESAPSHDLITETGHPVYTYHTHRMFILKYPYIDPVTILDAVHSSKEYVQEHEEFLWVPLKELLTIIEKSQGAQETLTMSYIDANGSKEIAIFPPMSAMLQQKPVQEHLRKAANKESLSPTRTCSHEKAQYQAFPQNPQLRFESEKNKEMKDPREKEAPSDPRSPVLEEAPKFVIGVKRFVDIDTKHEIQERIYPDPEAERRTFTHAVILSSTYLQTIKDKKPVSREEKCAPLESALEAQSLLPTQTIAHLQGLCQLKTSDPAQLVLAFMEQKKINFHIEDSVLQKIIEAVRVETMYPNHTVLYHAASAAVAFIYRFLPMFLSCLTAKKMPYRYRSFDLQFVNDTVQSFLNEPDQIFDDYKNYNQEKFLSCNFSLFYNYLQSSSSSLQYFVQNFCMANTSDKDADKVIANFMKMFLQQLQITESHVEDFVALFQKYQKDLGASLYQFFIPADATDKLCYLANDGGFLFLYPLLPTIEMAKKDQLSQVTAALQTDPEKVVPLLEQKYKIIEVRLLMHPLKIYNKEFVITKEYTAKAEPAGFQRELTQAMQRIVQEILQKKQLLDTLYSGSVDAEKKLPLQKKYAYVLQGECQEELVYDKHAFNAMLYRAVAYNQAANLKQLLDAVPENFSLQREFLNFYGDKETLLHTVIRHGNQGLATLEVLVNSKFCSPETLLHVNSKGEHVIFYAVSLNHAALIDCLLNSPHAQDIFARNQSLMPELLLESVKKYTEFALDSLLKSPYCALALDSDSQFFHKLLFDADGPHLQLLLKTRHYQEELKRKPYLPQMLLDYAISKLYHKSIEVLLETQYYEQEYIHHVITSAIHLDNRLVLYWVTNSKIVQELLYKNPELRQEFLKLAVKTNKENAIEYLLSTDNQTFQTNNSTVQDLFWEAVNSNSEMTVRGLVRGTYSYKIKDQVKEAFIQVVKQGDAKVIQVLEDCHHFDPQWLISLRINGYSPIDYAVKFAFIEVLKAFRKYHKYSKFIPCDLIDKYRDLEEYMNCSIDANFLSDNDKAASQDALKKCIPEFMMQLFVRGKTLLTWASDFAHKDLIRAILIEERYTEEFVMRRDSFHKNSLEMILDFLMREDLFEKYKSIFDLFLESTYRLLALKFLMNHYDLFKNPAHLSMLIEIILCKPKLIMQTLVDGDTFLIWAVKQGHVDIVNSLLLKDKCTEEFMNRKDKDGNTALMLALKNGNTDIIELFLHSKHAANKHTMYALQWIIYRLSSNANVLFKLQALLSSPHCKPKIVEKIRVNGDTLLIWAVKQGYEPVIDLLLNNHTDEFVSKVDVYGNNAFILAIKNGCINIVEKFLSKHGANKRLMFAFRFLKQLSFSFNKVRMLYVFLANPYIIKRLLNNPPRKALLNMADSDEYKALTTSIRRYNSIHFKLFLDSKHRFLVFQVHKNEDFFTELFTAVAQNAHAIIRLLLDEPEADKDFLQERNQLGQTALTAAIDRNLVSMEIILKSRKDSGYLEELLMPDGGYENSAMHWAENSKDEFRIEILLDYFQPVKIMQMDYDNQSFLLRMVSRGCVRIIEKLLSNPEYPLDFILRTNADGDNAFGLAIKNKRIDIVKILIQNQHISLDYLMDMHIGEDNFVTWALKQKDKSLKKVLINRFGEINLQDRLLALQQHYLIYPLFTIPEETDLALEEEEDSSRDKDGSELVWDENCRQGCTEEPHSSRSDIPSVTHMVQFGFWNSSSSRVGEPEQVQFEM